MMPTKNKSKFNLRRTINRSGDVIHLANCPHAKNARPWDRVDDMSGKELAEHVERYSNIMRWCKACEPDLHITVGTP